MAFSTAIIRRAFWAGAAAALASAVFLAAPSQAESWRTHSGLQHSLDASRILFETQRSDWPLETRPEHYWIDAHSLSGREGGAAQLRRDAAADSVRAALGRLGWTEVPTAQAARFHVLLDIGQAATRQWTEVRRFEPAWGGGFHSGYYGPRRWHRPDYGAGIIVHERVPVTVVRARLSVRVQDAQRDGRTVYQATASAPAGQVPNAIWPELARAIFTPQTVPPAFR